MATKRALEQRLAKIAGFERPSVELEQYPTPADIAAHLLHFADTMDDISNRIVLDLGTGTGMLALGAATRNPARVIGLDRDQAALGTARENEREVTPSQPVDWLCADATNPPLCPDDPVTVVMNPPFGAQNGQKHADRAFLAVASSIAGVSYSIHNQGSNEFVSSFADDNGGDVTHAFRAELALPRQFSFHEHDRKTIEAEVYRISWN